MNKLSIYEAVNKCETLNELAKIIESLADEEGMIRGRTRSFDASLMAEYCRNFNSSNPNVLTREFGIRQQAMYIKFYN